LNNARPGRAPLLLQVWFVCAEKTLSLPDHEAHTAAMRSLIHELAGEADTAGLEIMRLIHLVANAYATAVDEQLREAGLSGPRWGLLFRLLAEERCGCLDGVSPTRLSHHQNVSKNTISALLGGLEEQGLIERGLAPDDRRGFRIRLTAAGRQAVQSTAPAHLTFVNYLSAGLTADEREQLTVLLAKLHWSLVNG
jgi:DNA-binding MarR family transcriptional regulator